MIRVKIDGTWYCSEDVPICVDLSDGTRQNLIDAAPQFRNLYAEYPAGRFTHDQARKWMTE